MIQVEYPVDEYGSWWQPLCMAVVHKHDWYVNPLMGTTKRGPVLRIQPPDDHGLTREELQAKVNAIVEECAQVLYRRDVAVAAASLEALVALEKSLAEASSIARQLVDNAKIAAEAGKTTIEVAETAEKWLKLAGRLGPYLLQIYEAGKQLL